MKIVCHRGACLLAPENTFASARKALEIGGHIIELDIRQSADGVLYVMHDKTVDRTTNGTGAIAEMTSAEVDRLDAGAWFGPAFAGEPVPRLEAFLAEFAPRAGFYLEVKAAEPDRLATLLRRLGIAAQCFTFSFDPDIRQAMPAAIPELRRMIQWSAAGSAAAAKADHHAAIVEFAADNLSEATVAEAKAAGLQTMVFTPDPDRETFARARALNVDMVNIDHIELFLQTAA